MNSTEKDVESRDDLTASLPEVEKPKVYSIRWLILFLFVFFSASNAMQWIQYTIISNVIRDYYSVSADWVNWTSIIYMVLYIPFIFPGSYLLEKLVSGTTAFYDIISLKIQGVPPRKILIDIGKSINKRVLKV